MKYLLLLIVVLAGVLVNPGLGRSVTAALDEDALAIESVRDLVRQGRFGDALEVAQAHAASFSDAECRGIGRPRFWRALVERLGTVSLQGASPSGIWVGLVADMLELDELALRAYEQHLATPRSHGWAERHVIAGYMARCAARSGEYQAALGYLQRARELATGSDERGERYVQHLENRITSLEEFLARPESPEVRFRMVRGFLEQVHPPCQSPYVLAAEELESLSRQHAGALTEELESRIRMTLFGYANLLGNGERATILALRMALADDFEHWETRAGREALTYPGRVKGGWRALAAVATHLQENGHPLAAIRAWRPLLVGPEQLADRREVRWAAWNAACSISACYEELRDHERALFYLRKAHRDYYSGGLPLEATDGPDQVKRLELLIRGAKQRNV